MISNKPEANIPLLNQLEESHIQDWNPHAVRRITVEGLFGQYDYELCAKADRELDLSRLFIMYGDNGAGKTTILKMVYHALSSETGGGHRTFLARTRFKRFGIELNNGTVLEADRNVKGTSGSLLLTLRDKEKMLAGMELKIDESQTIRVTQNDEEERLKIFLRAIDKLKIRVHYLSDDRKHQGQLQEQSKRRAVRHTTPMSVVVDGTIRHYMTPDSMEDATAGDALQDVMHRVVSWVQHMVRRGATVGQGNVYEIYSKVISDIAHSGETNWDTLEHQSKQMIGTLKSLEETSKRFSVYGLSPPFPAGELISSLENADNDKLPIVYNVVKPHVDGIVARLNALSDIYTTISRFIDTINDFYRNKHVSFTVDRGFEILSGDEPLQPSLLSSGEKQLFLLLCNTILARKQASIFLIDEPELSLNVKWQRQLVQAVLTNTIGSDVQFIMSTHSMELISQHRNSVVRLAPKRSHMKGEDVSNVGGEA